jgi:SARP family transcriptional regulator, regulator of embCAB operon
MTASAHGDRSAKMLQFQVLGPLEVFDGDRVCTPTPPKVRRVLALLLLRANQVVSMDSLIEELWGEEPPLSAVGTAQTYIYQLRKILDPRGEHSVDREWLLTKAPGYLMRVSPNQLDASAFEALSWQGRQTLEKGHPEEASQLLRRALDLWKGPSLANVRLGHLLEAHAVHLEEQRMRALELRIQADAELGRHRELIGEMRSLVATHPLNEWFHGQLIVALSHSGRRGEALQAYQDLRRVLSSQLGLDPQPELQRLHREVLSHGRPTVSVFAPWTAQFTAA